MFCFYRKEIYFYKREVRIGVIESLWVGEVGFKKKKRILVISDIFLRGFRCRLDVENL